MKITTPITTDLAVGTNAVIDQTDSLVEVPPLVMPVALFVQPHNHYLTDEVIATSSGVRRILVTRGPSLPAINTGIFKLAPGLWELECQLMAHADFASTPTALALTSMSAIIQGIAWVFVSLPAIVGNTFQYTRWRLLLRNETPLQLNTPITGAGQNLAATAAVNAIRVI